MDLIFSHPGGVALLSPPALPVSAAPVGPVSGTSEADRISGLAALGQEDTVAGLLWLAMNFPAVCDAMLDKTECDAIDDEEFLCEGPEPYCTLCGAAVGIFTANGDIWRHYRWGYAPDSKPQVYDAGHEPQIGWRPARHPQSAVAY